MEKLAKNAQVYRIGGEVAVDRVCRCESLDEEMLRVWSELGPPGSPTLPRAKGQARPGRLPHQELYSPASRDRVATVFAGTIEAFGYAF